MCVCVCLYKCVLLCASNMCVKATCWYVLALENLMRDGQTSRCVCSCVCSVCMQG